MAPNVRRRPWRRAWSGGQPKTTLPVLESFDDVRSAVVIDVDLASGERVIPRSRSVQGQVHPNLIASALKPVPRPRVAIVEGGALVGDSGGVATSDGRLVMESLWDVNHWRRSFDPPPRLPPPRLVTGRHASLISLWSQPNFHHWLFEALPRLAILQASGVQYDGLIVPADLRPFQRDTLALAGVDLECLVPFTGNHLVVEELVWAAPLAPFEQPTPAAIRWLRRLVPHAPGSATERLYLQRRGARRLVNERAVLRLLEQQGFRSVDPGALTVVEQIELFASARVLVGSHGAAFSGGVFSTHLTAIELFQQHHVNISTTAALAAAGHDHWSLMCRRVPTPHRRRNHDLLGPLAALRATLEAAGLTG